MTETTMDSHAKLRYNTWLKVISRVPLQAVLPIQNDRVLTNKKKYQKIM